MLPGAWFIILYPKKLLAVSDELLAISANRSQIQYSFLKLFLYSMVFSYEPGICITI